MATMTRQHFETIAKSLRLIRPPLVAGDREAGLQYGMWAAVVGQLMVDLRHTNPLFNAERFVKACGVDNDAQFTYYMSL